jgi:ketosteroid isomerase-like protein
MSQHNVELSYRAAEAFNRRDLGAYLATQDEDVEGIPLAIDMEGVYRGHAGTRRWWAAQFGSFPDLTIEVLQISDPGDLTIAELRMRGHGAGGSVPVDTTIWRVSRWRDGRCTWWGSFRSEADAREAMGLSEQAGASSPETRPAPPA